MMIRVPSNRSLTPIARKGFRAPSWAGDRLAKWNLSAQIPLMGDTSRGRDLEAFTAAYEQRASSRAVASG